MYSRVATFLLAVGLAISLILLGRSLASWRLPGNQQGYEPVQPIQYSHRLHAGELQIPCLYCHSAAEKSRHAGIPSTNVCMSCHQFVSASWGAVRAEAETAKKEARDPQRIVSPELRKLYAASGVNPAEPTSVVKDSRPVEWIRIHELPDFAIFDHRPHVNAGVACQKCHGLVETMERVRQESTLSMGWCVQCHREANVAGVNGRPVKASLDCAGCHY